MISSDFVHIELESLDCDLRDDQGVQIQHERVGLSRVVEKDIFVAAEKDLYKSTQPLSWFRGTTKHYSDANALFPNCTAFRTSSVLVIS